MFLWTIETVFKICFWKIQKKPGKSRKMSILKNSKKKRLSHSKFQPSSSENSRKNIDFFLFPLKKIHNFKLKITEETSQNGMKSYNKNIHRQCQV